MILDSFLSLAQTSAPPAGQPGGMGSYLIPVVCFIVLIYFGIMRPQKLQQQKLASMIAALKTGDKVITSGGIHGIISNLKDGATLVLKVDDNCKMEVDKSAIATIKKD